MTQTDYSPEVTRDELGRPADLVTYNAGINRKIDFLTIEASTFEDFWRWNTPGGFFVGREAARRFVPLTERAMKIDAFASTVPSL